MAEDEDYCGVGYATFSRFSYTMTNHRMLQTARVSRDEVHMRSAAHGNPSQSHNGEFGQLKTLTCTLHEVMQAVLANFLRPRTFIVAQGLERVTSTAASNVMQMRRRSISEKNLKKIRWVPKLLKLGKSGQSGFFFANKGL
ncbi:hypothetical protein Y032_0378g309 [Ancylostoma ceylanicum]|uniref:Uncharacterized protein n=1 Tax=Ancylostoma ceylanicum TaxID=53326 RepID=A0A016RUJ2_9BILA|nr:hypothetical protein Y032_0378g309 [Ancylostoma ceylanicum]